MTNRESGRLPRFFVIGARTHHRHNVQNPSFVDELQRGNLGISFVGRDYESPTHGS